MTYTETVSSWFQYAFSEIRLETGMKLHLSSDFPDETRFNSLFRSIPNEFTCTTSSNSFIPYSTLFN